MRRKDPEAATADINAVRQARVTQEFRDAIGLRVLLLMDDFPFLVIGEIIDVLSDFVLVNVQTTHIQEIEGRVIRVHLDEVEVFHIERPGQPPIPDLS